jgi:hypothetical protein
MTFAKNLIFVSGEPLEMRVLLGQPRRSIRGSTTRPIGRQEIPMTRPHPRLLAFVAAALCGSVTAFAQTPVDSGWTYQGRLTDNGAPANGPYDLRFSLYSNSAGTIMVGAVQNLAGVTVSAGLFTVNLSFPNQFAGSKRWLKLEISPAGAGTYTALPLQEITSAPQAIFAQTLGLPFTANGNVASPGSVFTINNSGTGYSLRAQNDSPTGGVGVYGLAAASTGANTGGRFESNSTSGYGVIGFAPAVTGINFGIYGQSESVGRVRRVRPGKRHQWSNYGGSPA